jgi:glucose uptake protein
MILPQTFPVALVVLLLSLACLSFWANTYKMAGKLRYELYYFDWIVGAFVCVTVIALTLGSLGFDGFSFRDDLLIAARKSWLFAFVAGGLFSMGNLLTLASLSLGGMAVAFPLAAGVSISLAAPASFFMHRDRPATFLILGCALALAGTGIAVWVHRSLAHMRHEEVARAGKAKSTRRPSSLKPVILAAVGGLLMGSAAPLADRAQAGEIGLGPYSFSFLFTFGALVSALVLNLFLMNLPVEGDPLEILDYLRGKRSNHIYGFVGGVIWGLGLVGSLVPIAAALPPAARLSIPVSYGLTQAPPLFAALWGIFLWKELRGLDTRFVTLAGLMLLLLAGGVLVLALAPIYAAR